MARHPIDPGELARISGTILEAMAQAKALNEAGATGERLTACVGRARDSYDMLLARLISAEPSTAQYARGLADSMGHHLSELEQMASSAPSKVH